MLSYFVLAGLLPVVTLASPIQQSSPFKRAPASHSGSWQWFPCFDNPNIECTTFSTFLDYADPSPGNATLAVIRYKATKSPKIGTLWTNPGGPGGSGIDAIAGGDGELLSNITGGYYDIASWDPRGVNNSLPQVNCFESGTEETNFWSQTVITGVGMEVKGNFTDPTNVAEIYNQTNAVDQLLQQFGQLCLKNSGNNLRYVGSPAAVRDMVAMTDILDGPGAPVNYWGFSYGTIIGDYFVNMFPERVGRLIIDGVVNPYLWADVGAYKGWGDAIADTDKVLQAFADACAQAGPSACAISGGQTGTVIFDWVKTLIDDAYDAYRRGSNVTSSAIRGRLHGAMYQPRSWDTLASWLAIQYNVIHSNSSSPLTGSRALIRPDAPSFGVQELTDKLDREILGEGPKSGSAAHGRLYTSRKIQSLLQRRDVSSSDPPGDYSFQAITCADAPDSNYTTKDVFDEIARVTQQVSQVFGPQWGDATMYCHRWPTRAVERFTGPFNHTLNDAILVIGNEADPITPYHDAKFAADQLGNSAILLQQEGFGHTSLAMHSDCTIEVIATYLISGKLPSSDDKLCATNQPLFSPNEFDASNVAPITNITAVPEQKASTSSGKTNGAFTTAIPSASSMALVAACLSLLL